MELIDQLWLLHDKLLELAVAIDPEYVRWLEAEAATEALWGIVLQMEFGGPIDAIPIERRDEFADGIEPWFQLACAMRHADG